MEKAREAESWIISNYSYLPRSTAKASISSKNNMEGETVLAFLKICDKITVKNQITESYI